MRGCPHSAYESNARGWVTIMVVFLDSLPVRENRGNSSLVRQGSKHENVMAEISVAAGELCLPILLAAVDINGCRGFV